MGMNTYISLFCPFRGLRNNDNTVVTSAPSPQSSFLNTIFHKKEPRLLKKIANSSPATRQVQRSLKHFVVPKRKEVLKERWRHVTRTKKPD